MSLKYEKKSLFDVQGKAILTHAANCKGVMGSGIAKEFKRRFPEAVAAYAWDFNRTGQRGSLPIIGAGTAKIYKTNNPNIFMGCLFTSWNYGKFVDKPGAILDYTKFALPKFLRLAQAMPEFKIYSNKFNSGLFNVPWEQTEALIVEALKAYPEVDWIVCDPQLAPSSNG
jgi:ADP-ribose 1''-phosphate phosphatase